MPLGYPRLRRAELRSDHVRRSLVTGGDGVGLQFVLSGFHAQLLRLLSHRPNPGLIPHRGDCANRASECGRASNLVILTSPRCPKSQAEQQGMSTAGNGSSGEIRPWTRPRPLSLNHKKLKPQPRSRVSEDRGMSPIGTFRKCQLRRLRAALGSKADSSKAPEGAFMSSRPSRRQRSKDFCFGSQSGLHSPRAALPRCANRRHSPNLGHPGGHYFNGTYVLVEEPPTASKADSGADCRNTDLSLRQLAIPTDPMRATRCVVTDGCPGGKHQQMN
jgi:hypothetical protein